MWRVCKDFTVSKSCTGEERMDRYLNVIDAAKGDPESDFADQGSKLIARGRDLRNLKPMRDLPKGLPATLFDGPI